MKASGLFSPESVFRPMLAASHMSQVETPNNAAAPHIEMRVSCVAGCPISPNSVVASDAQDGGIPNPDMMWKRLSDALYHNAYMRDDGVIATVADHIAATLKPAR